MEGEDFSHELVVHLSRVREQGMLFDEVAESRAKRIFLGRSIDAIGFRRVFEFDFVRSLIVQPVLDESTQEFRHGWKYRRKLHEERGYDELDEVDLGQADRR